TAMITRSRASYVSALDPSCPVKSEEPTTVDSLWLRLIDVRAALTARGYSSACDVVLDVVDPVCPWNQRAWRLSVDDQGVATCQPTGDEADVRLPVQALGAAYLGSRSIAAQAHQGRVTELKPGTLRRLSRAMSSDREPVGATQF
ncbi:MAG: GNAT family N-acetyltransferase, partial [Phycicoccus sp.]|nr:GNAT family N-acetyltransferase [Phycicoccus sp.]